MKWNLAGICQSPSTHCSFSSIYQVVLGYGGRWERNRSLRAASDTGRMLIVHVISTRWKLACDIHYLWKLTPIPDLGSQTGDEDCRAVFTGIALGRGIPCSSAGCKMRRKGLTILSDCALPSSQSQPSYSSPASRDHRHISQPPEPHLYTLSVCLSYRKEMTTRAGVAAEMRRLEG